MTLRPQPSIPEEFAALADGLPAHLEATLGPEFVGLYVYGSSLDESFVRGVSDFDCIAVTAGSIVDASLHELRTLLAQAASTESAFKRVQMALLVRDRVLEDDPTACLYQFGSLTRSGSDGNPIIWLDFFQRGRTLRGPDPRSFVPAITPTRLHGALVREIGYLRDEISLKPESEWREKRSYRIYAVLTLCRILYTNTTGEVISKIGAAEWARATQPTWVGTLAAAAAGIRSRAGTADVHLPEVRRLIDFTAGRLGDSAG